MEGLQKLEQVQRAIHLMQAVGISEPNPDSMRFLADFTFFVMQSGDPDITSKCQLISKHVSKIWSLCTSGALQSAGKSHCPVENFVPPYYADKTNLDPVRSFYGDEAVVGIDAMIRSNSTLEDFCRSYFMFHEMEVNQPQSIFRYLPLLSFTESYIYQLDGLNEKLLLLPGGGSPILNKDFVDNDSSLGAESVKMIGKDSYKPLLLVLEHHGILTERIKEELMRGEEYWALERKLCCALARNKEISIEDVNRAIHLKSFDYRVLNLLLYQLRGEKVNELHMEFLLNSELLVEVSDDLIDYEDDVLENNFNILRMFVKYYGASAAPVMMAKFISEAEEKYHELTEALGPDLSNKYQKRCVEATKEGGKIHGPSLGTWQMPPVIEDENQYRAAVSTSRP